MTAGACHFHFQTEDIQLMDQLVTNHQLKELLALLSPRFSLDILQEEKATYFTFCIHVQCIALFIPLLLIDH